MPCLPQAVSESAAAAASAVIRRGPTRRASYCLQGGRPQRGTARSMADQTVDEAAFRSAVGLLPTGVTVVTAFGEAGPSGATANAVTSLSLQPMLMLACLDRGSRTLRSVQSAGRFGVNVLGAGHQHLARQFSTKVPEPDK